ncbi:unnamed protein product [Ectocarpus sp. 12 AP-2014]
MKFGKNLSKSFVRGRRQRYEEHLHVSDLRENLTHEEFGVPVDSIYDFSHGKDAKEVGGFGEVQVVIHRKTGTRYAMKTVKLSSVKSEKAFDFIMNEVDLLKTLDHPNIVRLQEVYMSDSHLFMAMDLITGGNLARGYRCDGEHTAAIIIRQIVRALRYLHDRHIAVCTRFLASRETKVVFVDVLYDQCTTTLTLPAIRPCSKQYVICFLVRISALNGGKNVLIFCDCLRASCASVMSSKTIQTCT